MAFFARFVATARFFFASFHACSWAGSWAVIADLRASSSSFLRSASSGSSLPASFGMTAPSTSFLWTSRYLTGLSSFFAAGL